MNSFPPSNNYRDINEGKYDSLVTKLAGFTLNAWKGDFEDGQNKGLIEIEVGPGLDFDYPHLKFIYKAEARFGGFYKSSGAAIPDPIKGLPRVRLSYNIPIDELPRMWSQISMDLRNTIRHEIEHLMQSGPNVKKGKEKAPDRAEREELMTGKKPWWKIWRKTLGTPEYYKLEKEIDANLEGLYLQAKKSRKPLEQIIDNYLKFTLNLKPEDRADIKALWKERAPKLNIPLEEGDTYEKMAAKGKKAGKLKQGTVRKRLNIPKGKKIPLSKINKELARLRKMDKDKDKKGVQLGDKNQKYYKALQLSKTLKTTTNVNEISNLTEEELNEKLCKRGKAYIAKRKRAGEKHNPFLAARAVKVCKGQMSGVDGKQKKDFRPKKGKTRSAQGRKPDIVKEIGINLSNYKGQILPGDVLRAPKGFPLGGKKLEKSLQLKVIKNSREGVNRYKLSLEDENGKKYSVRNYEMDGEYKGKKLPKWGLVRKSKKNINENATYTKKINLIDILSRFTQHMLDKGMNIQPLPMLQMIDGDVDNASQFLGKTAYYDPNTQTIVLYTEGRHPKDIARSYAHEMIHHIQYLENRLDNVQTTNTLEDERLNKLEQEANLRGTMTFRNWTDSLNEVYKHKFGFDKNLGKDPFGLNQFAREIATEVENAMNKEKYKIFSDMDGVITDFNGRFEKYSDGIPPSEYEKRFGKEKFWELADGKGVAFWVGMPWTSDGKRYWDYIKKYDVELLSSPSRSETSRLGKRLWVRNNLPGIKLTLAQAAKKQNYAAPNHILIDDRKSNIEQWRSQGGIGILHTSAADTIEQLKKLGL